MSLSRKWKFFYESFLLHVFRVFYSQDEMHKSRFKCKNIYLLYSWDYTFSPAKIYAKYSDAFYLFFQLFISFRIPVFEFFIRKLIYEAVFFMLLLFTFETFIDTSNVDYCSNIPFYLFFLKHSSVNCIF